ncbi:aspartate:alanine exchanger family transporter [Corynebacterium heidelbergense]|uniref:Transporter n=1 Tax=Corynebacterium heidelbergense TaxID=2055947 RepID=A0A364V7H2_9CORY|nr:aspartate:alanine exchanger family transporter [Corynebacterium heidelbergense]RAV32571.1 transporter [Corynebacterium heidelbergense]
MLAFLADHSLIALIVILAAGLAIGRLRIFGMSLGAAAILFVAIFLSALDSHITFPPLIYQLGLALFVYSIGLAAGREFFASFASKGWRVNVFGGVMLLVLMGLAAGLAKLFGLDPTTASGTFAGSLTTTPGMAAIVELLKGTNPDLAAHPVVGYSLAYPGGVLGAIAVAAIGAGILKVNHIEDATREGLIHSRLRWRTVEIGEGVSGHISDVPRIAQADIIVTRMSLPDEHGGYAPQELAVPNTPLTPGLLLVIHGTDADLDTAISHLGAPAAVDVDMLEMSYGRVIVSNPAVAGRTIRDLDPISHGFIIARLRRGDEEVVAHESDMLELSDSLRVVAPKEQFPAVRRLLGDSENSLANVDLLPFAIGLLLGLLLGAIPIPLPGGTSLSLGFGGGPIVVGLLFGAFSHTGPVQWHLPYHANRVFTTFGLALFLAGVGTVAGPGFRNAMTDPASLKYIAMGFIITVTSALACGVVGMTVLKLRWDESMGMAAGMTTNPAVLGYLNNQTGTELAARGYATVYPIAMIGKILLCQALVVLLM